LELSASKIMCFSNSERAAGLGYKIEFLKKDVNHQHVSISAGLQLRAVCTCTIHHLVVTRELCHRALDSVAICELNPQWLEEICQCQIVTQKEVAYPMT
jgi:hypothetical protein